MKSEYQSHIDILRALAVLLVIVNHLDFSFFSGGFIGVDVFFVISGYLITKNILSEKKKSGSFSFKLFYQRRVLRLAPAFFSVLSICSIAFYLILTPEEWVQYLKTVVATVTLTSNIYYTILLNDYFSISGKSTPLLHIWSLSLEEQFYLIWPVLLLGIIQLSQNLKIFSLFSITILSLIASHILIQSNPIAAYYLLPSRIFEFTIGAALVFLPSSKPKKNTSIILSILFISIIVASSFFINNQSLFPSYTALFPCVTAAGFIYFGKHFTGRATKWIEYIGKISYPMYLWHWPIIVYFTQQSIKLDAITKILIIIITIIFSIFTYEKIEKSIKTSSKKIKKPVKLLFITPSLIVGTLSILWIIFDKNMNHIEKTSNDIKCIDQNNHPINECFLGEKSINEVSVLLVGDSHANAQANIINQLLLDSNLKGYEITTSSTAFLYNINRSTQNQRTQKIQLVDNFYKKNLEIATLIKTKQFKYVVMGGYFPHNWKRNLYSTNLPPSTSTSKAFFIEGLKNSITLIEESGAIPVLMNDNPILTEVDANCHVRSSFSDCSFERKKYEEDAMEWHEILNTIKKEHKNLVVIDFNNIVCNKSACFSSLNNVALYRDNQHLTYAGSKQIGIKYLKQHTNPFQ